MDSVEAMHTQQINVMSNQIFEQNRRLNAMHDQLVILGSQLQNTQIHISAVDGRMPAWPAIIGVMRTLAEKINEVVHRIRTTEEEERFMAADLDAINMELAMGDLCEKKGAKCNCQWTTLCDECF